MNCKSKTDDVGLISEEVSLNIPPKISLNISLKTSQALSRNVSPKCLQKYSQKFSRQLTGMLSLGFLRSFSLASSLEFSLASSLALQLAFLCSVMTLIPSLSLADSKLISKRSGDLYSPQRHYLVAQVDPDESYDPFSDYSEFDEESEEEADINFFRNGRFLTVGIAGGYRSFTGNFAEQYQGAPSFGLYLSYFFDLRLALSMGFQMGDHTVSFTSNSQSNTYNGSVSLSSLNFDLKYYLNTQNVTRGLADLNPYILAGMGEFYRTYSLTGLDGYARDSTMGFDFGAGLEIPLMRKKAYLGIEGIYHYVNFSDEGKTNVNTGTVTKEVLDKTLSGDFYEILFILGMNF